MPPEPSPAPHLLVERSPIGPLRLPVWWLRDRCRCETCLHPSGQRTVDAAALRHATIGSWELRDGTLRVVWHNDGHRSDYALDELDAARPAGAAPARWDGSLDPVPRADHTDLLADPTALADWLTAVDRLGFALVGGVPVVDGEVARFAARFAHVRVTNYGSYFDVRSVVDPTNLAYSALGLAPHTDNPYRDPVPTLQLLHCLASTTTGGDSSVVDGFHAAERLRAADPEAFAALACGAVEFGYRDDDTELIARAPIFEVGAGGELRAVRFNPRSLRPPALGAPDLDAWYRGYVAFAELVDDPSMRVTFHLEPGELFVVDNRRVLHGRTGFDPTAGTRHLQGCYADIDGLRSTLAVLRRRSGA